MHNECTLLCDLPSAHGQTCNRDKQDLSHWQQNAGPGEAVVHFYWRNLISIIACAIA